MAAKPVRVVVEIHARQVRIHLFSAGVDPTETERFGLTGDVPDIVPEAVGRDVFNLLYQCALDATTTDD